MNTEKFEKSVVNLANDRVQKKLEAFKKDIRNAFEKVTGTRWFGMGNPDRKANIDLLLRMAENKDVDLKGGCPSYLWRTEEEKVRKELFGMMDTVQQALLAPEPSDDDEKPTPETTAEAE